MNVLLLTWVSLFLVFKSVQSAIAIKGGKLSQIEREEIDIIPDDDDIKVRKHLVKEAVNLNKSSQGSKNPADTTKKEKSIEQNHQKKVNIDANINVVRKDEGNNNEPGKPFKIVLMGNPYERSGDEKINDEKMIKEIMAQLRKGNELIKSVPQKHGKDSNYTPYTNNKNVSLKENRMYSDSERAAIIKPNIIDLIKPKDNKDSGEIEESIRKKGTITHEKPHKKVDHFPEIVSGSQEHKYINDCKRIFESEEDEEEMNKLLSEINSFPIPYLHGAAANLQYRGRSGDPHDHLNKESDTSTSIKASDIPLDSNPDEKLSVGHQHTLNNKIDDGEDDLKHKDKKYNKYHYGFNSITPNNIISTLPNRKYLKDTNGFERQSRNHYIAPTINLNDSILLYHNNIILLGQNGTNPRKPLHDLNSIIYGNNPSWHQKNVGLGTNVQSQFYQNYYPFRNIPNQHYNNDFALKNYQDQSNQNYVGPKNSQSQYPQNYNKFRNYPYLYHHNVYAVGNYPYSGQQDYSALRNGWTYQWEV